MLTRLLLPYRHGMSRYQSEPASGWSRTFWFVRGCLRDTQTDERIETRKLALAEELGTLLEEDDSGALADMPSGASPFRAYDTLTIEPWSYLIESRRANDGEYVARSQSQAFVRRAADVLNRAHPRALQPSDHRIRAGWW
jgi:hypothetical protein